jgi:pimeloyl-ACP methyl ester carboxylesterase
MREAEAGAVARAIHSVDAGGHRLRCSVSGDGSPVFVCLHGLVDRIEIWDRLAPALALRGRVVCIDQRGHGQSDAPAGPCERADLARDVVAVLDALGIARAVLVGHSMGGIVSMATALARPDRVEGLVLIGTASRCSAAVADWYEEIAAAGDRDGLAGIARAIYGEASRRRIEGSARGIADVTRMLKGLHADPLTPQLAKIACPTLILVGETDPMGPRASEVLRDALPPGTARLEAIPGRGHWLHVEACDEVVRALDAWMGDRA